VPLRAPGKGGRPRVPAEGAQARLTPRDAAAQRRLDERGREHSPRPSPRQGSWPCLRAIRGGVRRCARPSLGRRQSRRPLCRTTASNEALSVRRCAPARGTLYFRFAQLPSLVAWWGVTVDGGSRDGGPLPSHPSPSHRCSPWYTLVSGVGRDCLRHCHCVGCPPGTALGAWSTGCEHLTGVGGHPPARRRLSSLMPSLSFRHLRA
jgi:hypothetical protein